MENDESPIKLEPEVELNRRGIPARKRKKNSLIFGDDDLVSLPVRSPRKKAAKPAAPPPPTSPPASSSRGGKSQKTTAKELKEVPVDILEFRLTFPSQTKTSFNARENCS